MEEDNEFGRGHSLFLEGALLIFGGSGPYFWNNCSDSAEVVSLDWATENPTKSSSITWQTAIKQKQKKVNGSRQPSTPQSLTHEHPFLSLPQTYYWSKIKPDEQVYGSGPHDITVWYFVVVKVRCKVPRLRQWPCTHSSNSTAWQTATKRAKETWWKKTTSLGGGTPYFWRGHSLFLEGAVLIFETTVLTLQK